MKTKLGITFTGGGGKGAYEIGVWKALREYGVDKSIQAVSGTSVGALNGALFIKGDYALAENIWSNMSQDQILQVNSERIIEKIVKLKLPTEILNQIGSVLGKTKNFGLFSQKGLQEIIEKNISLEEIQNASLPFYTCATEWSGMTLSPVYTKMNNLPDNESMVQYLLASAAIPGIFGRIILENKTLWDGFLTDNTPVRPLIEQEKCNKIIVVMLGREDVYNNHKYPGVKFWTIVPSEDINELFGGLDFTAETASKLLNMGYADTCKILQEIYEFSLIEERYVENADTIKLQDLGYKKLVADNSYLRSAYKAIETSENVNSIQFLLENSGAELIKQEAFDLDVYEKEMEEVSTQIDLDITDAEKIILNESIDATIESMKDNSTQIMDCVFDGITSLASTEGRINSQKEQGLVSRILGNLTGRNQKVQAEINWQFQHAIYANQQMIKKLAERNNLTMDVCISLANKINYLAINQKSLQIQDLKQMKMIQYLHDGILGLADATRNALTHIDNKIEELEYGQKLLFWNGQLTGEVNMLNQYDKIMKTTAQYFAITKNDISNSADKLFYGALCNIGLGEKQKINPASFIEYVIENKEKSHALLFNDVDSCSILPVPQHEAKWLPVLKSLELVFDANKDLSFGDVMSLLENEFNMNLSTEILAADFAFELLNGFRMSNTLTQELNSPKDKMTANLSEIKNLLNDAKTSVFDNEIELLQKEVEGFAIIVPLVGKFSAGKSRLLNSYLGVNELLKTDTEATTALATELRYSQNEYGMAYYIDGTIEKINIDEIDSLISEKIAYLQLYLNNHKLKHRQDLVLVDMPGFESKCEYHNKAINLYVDKGHHYIMVVGLDSYTDHSIMKSILEFKSYEGVSSIITKADKKPLLDVLNIKKDFETTIKNKFTEDIFVGLTRPDDIADFERTVDHIYAQKAEIFKTAFDMKYTYLLDKIIKHFELLINAQPDNDELEERIKEQHKQLEFTRKKMMAKLEDLKWTIVNDASNEISEKVSNILNSNESTLISTAKRGGLKGKITDMIRPPLNNIMRSVIIEAMQELKEETRNIQQEMDCDSFFIPQINISPDNITQVVMCVGGGGAGLMVGGGAGIAAGGMAVTGALTGTILGPVGAVLGVLVGLGIGWFASKAAKEEKEENFKASVRSAIAQAISDITNNAKSQLEIVHQNIIAIVEDIIAKAEAEANESIEKIKEDMKKNEEEYNKQKERRVEIVEKLTKLHE